MIHLTLAIADFMGILIGAALATALSAAGVALLAAAAMGATLWTARALVRRLLGR